MDEFIFKGFKDFIGKTIQNVGYHKGWLDIKFTDGAVGCIHASLPVGTDRNGFFLSGGINNVLK